MRAVVQEGCMHGWADSVTNSVFEIGLRIFSAIAFLGRMNGIGNPDGTSRK